MQKAKIMLTKKSTFEVECLLEFEFRSEIFFIFNEVDFETGNINKEKFDSAHFYTGRRITKYLSYFKNCTTPIDAVRVAKNILNKISFENLIKAAIDQNGVINRRQYEQSKRI